MNNSNEKLNNNSIKFERATRAISLIKALSIILGIIDLLIIIFVYTRSPQELSGEGGLAVLFFIFLPILFNVIALPLLLLYYLKNKHRIKPLSKAVLILVKIVLIIFILSLIIILIKEFLRF